MSQGKIIILSGPSGSGKTTLYKRLLACPAVKGRLLKTISMTTRPMRSGERHGRDYFFVSPSMFEYKKRAGHFLEYQKVFNCFYGTPGKQVADFLRRGKNVLLCIDVKGAEIVSKRFPDAVKIFVKAPSWQVLKKRLEARGSETKASLALRLNTAREELRQAGEYDFVVVNDHLGRAFARLSAAVEEILGDSTSGK